mgnify:CR=1 FL=1
MKMFTFAYMKKMPVFSLILFLWVWFMMGCTNRGYRLSYAEIDDLADFYPAQAKVFLERNDSNDDKGYYKLLATKIQYQLAGRTYLHDYIDIDQAIAIFRQQGNTPLLARSLYYRGALTLNNTHDTTAATKWLMQASQIDFGMREKEKLDLYNLLCRITNDNTYAVKLEEEARQSHNTALRAWATLYMAINNGDTRLADDAFDIAYNIPENKDSTLGPMYTYYFEKLIQDGNVPDSIIMDYIEEADQWQGIQYNASFDLYQFLWRYGNTPRGKKFLSDHKPVIFLGDHYSGVWSYDYLLPIYFVYLHQGDTLTADTIARYLHQSEPFIAKENSAAKAREVKLMYDGGNIRFRYEQTKSWMLVGIIVILLALLAAAYLVISRMRKARLTINALHDSLHQLKDVENASLSEQCKTLNHDINTQLRKLRRRNKDIETYKAQIGELTDISQGLVYYSMAIQNQNISQIGKLGIRQLLASYKMIDSAYASRLDNYDLTPSQCLFCILYHMGKTDEEVMQTMQYSMANIRVRKSRIKSDCEADSFEAVVSQKG